MQVDIGVEEWNANGLSNHQLEIEIFLKTHHIDIMLVSEIHFTSRSYFKIKGYDLLIANHPSNIAYGGAAILIRYTIKYEELDPVSESFLQAAIIKIYDDAKSIIVPSVYLPPRYNVTKEEFSQFYKKLGSTFLAGGDYNAKHP